MLLMAGLGKRLPRRRKSFPTSESVATVGGFMGSLEKVDTFGRLHRSAISMVTELAISRSG